MQWIVARQFQRHSENTAKVMEWVVATQLQRHCENTAKIKIME